MQSVPALKGHGMGNLAGFKNLHSAATVLVCGCGTSLNQLHNPQDFITIGVNDVGRRFDPTYLVVLNPRQQFKNDRFRYVERSRARVLFTQLDLGIRHPRIVRFRLGRRGGVELDGSDRLPYTRNSPYVALCLALLMGANRIGLIGVDFTDDHFFASTGRHPLANSLAEIDREYARLAQVWADRGVEIVNLSQHSRLTAFPKVSLADWTRTGKTADKGMALNIVSYATTPVAGVPAILARCIDQATPHRARCVWASNGYGNGVAFRGDVQWQQNPAGAAEILADADAVIVHNGKVDPRHRPLLAHKPLITLAHNYGWNVDQTRVRAGMPGAVVGQYQATLPEFRGWAVVPNPVPLWEQDYRPGPKPPTVTLCYTPSGRHERYPRGHRLYWHSKGYDTTMAVLERLARRFDLQLEVIGDRQVCHPEALAMKRRAHIVIDECVTGSYHRNSLEGLATGCVVVNGVGLLPGVVETLTHCSGQDGEPPFVRAGLDTLEARLTELIEAGGAALQQQGLTNRAWMERHWAFAEQWQRFWQPLVDRARERRRGSLTTVAGLRKTPPRPPKSSGPRPVPPDAMTTIPTYWTCRGEGRGNFGDMLSPLIVRALSGRPARFEPRGPRLLAIGSLLKFARNGDWVWGAGFIAASDTCDPGIRVSAVRGPLTRRILLDLGIDCPEVYGDPALLLPGVRKLPVRPNQAIGIIPHYVDYTRVRATVRDRGIRIIDIRAGIEAVLDQVSRCALLLSSSLHGCVVGDAYGIPTVWVRISDQVVGDGFKFRDYYAGTGREAVCIDWRKGFDLDAGIRAARDTPPVKPELLDQLAASFPFLRERDCRPTATPLPAPRPVVVTRSADETEPRLAIYSAGTENYLACMVTSLVSFRRHNPQRPFDYYILGHGFSRPSRELIQRQGIGYLDLDLSRVFQRNRRDRYPSECFWIFKGPDLFGEMGYPYSLSIDGDIWCNRTLDLNWLDRVEHLAGIDRGSSVARFLTGLGGYPLLRKRFAISEHAGARKATNSGVVFYNNRNLMELGFFDRIAELYRRSEEIGVHRSGDDSLLALLLAVHPEIRLLELEPTWNAYQGLNRRFPVDDPRYREHRAEWLDEARIVHLAGIKPWEPVSHYPNRVSRHFIEAWRRLGRELCGGGFPAPAGARPPARPPAPVISSGPARLFPVRCYWYRGSGPNFGDETTPYLVRKIAGLCATARLRERPRDPRTLDEPVLLAVGSILRLCGGNSVVWGSGIRNIDQPVARARRFCAVRGPLTRRRLLELGYDCPAIYGDPALLLPRYFRPAVAKRHSLGIIPHQQDYPQLRQRYGRCSEVLVIDIATTDIEKLIRQVLSCHCTVSTALHGLVVSVAYGLPTRWLRFSDRIMGDDSKFYDFFASLAPGIEVALDRYSVSLPPDDPQLEPYRPLVMGSAPLPPRALIQATRRYPVTVDLDRLLAACPFDHQGWRL